MLCLSGFELYSRWVPLMFCERLNLELFRNVSVHEFYRLKALITLEQVNTTKWSGKKTRLLISKTAMVRCCKR